MLPCLQTGFFYRCVVCVCLTTVECLRLGLYEHPDQGLRPISHRMFYFPSLKVTRNKKY